MRNLRLLLILATLLPFSAIVYGQILPCGTPEVDIVDSHHQAFAKAAQSYSRKTNAPVKVIPVVFHVISESTSSPANISQSQIESGITVLNNAFRGIYGGVDTEIEFCLAGVNRIQDPIHFTVQLGINDDLVKALSQEDPELYLNVWTVNSLYDATNLLIGGFTIYPKFLATSPQLDGVLIDHRFVGEVGTATNNTVFELGRGLVHEVGHWLNLFHTFENGCDDNWTCGFMGDCCCDTPPQMKELDGCRKRRNSCHGDNPDERDPVYNYMGYSDDDCRTEFTTCQATRMHLTLDSIRQFAWFIQGGDCPQLRLADGGTPTFQPLITIYPNPATEKSVLEIRIAQAENIAISVYDIMGRQIIQLQEPRHLKPGSHTFPLPQNLPSGRYFVQIQIGTQSTIKALQVN